MFNDFSMVWGVFQWDMMEYDPLCGVLRTRGQNHPQFVKNQDPLKLRMFVHAWT